MSEKNEDNEISSSLNSAKTRNKRYTEAELDQFVDGFIESKASKWQQLVNDLGLKKARAKIKEGFRKMDERFISNKSKEKNN